MPQTARKLSCLCQIFHVWWFDVHHIEALTGVVQMPQVHSEVIARNEGLLITADGNGIDVVCVGIAKDTLASCLHDLLHARNLQENQHHLLWPD